MADIYVCPICGKTPPCDCESEIVKMLKLRKELDPDAPDMIVFLGRGFIAAKTQRHPQLRYEDYQRIQETLDSLPDYPTEEEAEAILQAHGTSGKEVNNSFIERLLEENLRLKRLVEIQSTESDSDLTSLSKVMDENSELRQVVRMCLQQFEFTYGQRKRGWDAKFLMERCTVALATKNESSA